MDNVHERIELLCKQAGISGAKMCSDLGMSRSFLTELRKGRAKSIKIETASKIADYFGVTVEYLLGKEQKETPTLTAKDERDIARDLERIRDALENEDTIMFDGDPMSDEARDSIMNAIELGLQAAKLKNKEKYTPKKYRKG